MAKIKQWCKEHNYSAGIESIVRDLQKTAKYNDNDLMNMLGTVVKTSQEFGISIQEILQHILFMYDRY